MKGVPKWRVKMANTLNIFQRMSKITEELSPVAKNLTVGYGNNSYKAVSERDVLDAVKPLEIKWGVYSYPFSREILEAQTYETTRKDMQGNESTSTTFFTRIRTVYRFLNVDQPGEYLDITSFAEGIDPQDKGSGKAMTYADKYALLKAYKISTGEDPDREPSEGQQYRRATEGQKAAKPAKPAQQEKPERAPVERAEYPSKEQKKIMMDTAEALGKDCFAIMRQAGWTDGSQLTMGQYSQALKILQDLSNAQAQA